MRPFPNLHGLLVLLFLIPSCALTAQTKDDTLRMMNESIRMMFDTKDIEVQPSYSFQHRVRYDNHKMSWKGAVDEQLELLFTDGSGVIGIRTRKEEDGQKLDLMMVFDHPGLVSLSFMHADTVDLCMRMRIPDPFKDPSPWAVHYTRSKKTRTIAGMKAVLWSAETDKETIELWIAPVAGDLGPVFKAWGKLQGQRPVTDGDFDKGLILAGTLKKKDGDKPYAQFEATGVELNAPFTFSSAGYRIQ